MNHNQTPRISYEDSCIFLRTHYHISLEPDNAIPSMPDRRPDIYSSDGVRFFRTWVGLGRPVGLANSCPEDNVEVAEHSLANLTLPRTFIGRSEVSFISFQNTDLSESTLCWNDFIEVDFTDADLSDADLRASLYKRVTFVRTGLRNADLRHSRFKECDFTDADMAGVKLTPNQGERIDLSDKQRQSIDWQDDAGNEPLGG